MSDSKLIRSLQKEMLNDDADLGLSALALEEEEDDDDLSSADAAVESSVPESGSAKSFSTLSLEAEAGVAVAEAVSDGEILLSNQQLQCVASLHVPSESVGSIDAATGIQIARLRM